MLPQSDAGGGTPRPRKLILEMNSTTNTRRRPKSVASGIAALGRTSARMIHQMPSPRVCAASTKVLDHDVEAQRARYSEYTGGVYHGRRADEHRYRCAQRGDHD